MSDKQYFHFTIGPVQGFVAQARRTRDFWAGSFILSCLVTVAMKAVVKQGDNNTIEFPLPDDSFMKTVESGNANIKQGNVPNRFKAEVSKAFKPELVEQAVRTAWKELAEAVWKKDLENFSLKTAKTREIWERQIEGFWDIQWAIIDDESESSTLDKLKNWRTHLPAPEAGVKCMMMDGWQELSGAERPGRKEEDSEGPYNFWNTLREGKEVDLREKEYLCAVAYVKRRFVHVFESLKIDMGSWTAHGWKIPKNVPSVDYMAAAPWLAQLLKKAKEDTELEKLMWDFHDAAVMLTRDSSEIPTLGYPEWQSNIDCVREANKEGSKKWQALDGRVFFDSMLENPRLWDKGPNGTKAEDAQSLLKQLKVLRKKAALEPVSPFYAILMMDGDDLGKQMSDVDKQEYITKGLSDFTKEVEGIVDKHSGFLVYAGGDDVLAILPLEYAMDCAVELRTTYDAVFREINKEARKKQPEDKQVWIQTSISAAIEYAHIKTPLGKLLGDSHKLLDNIAKDQHGRDSIACRVWKPGGLQMEWGMPWDKALDDDNRMILDAIADQFRAGKDDKNDEREQFASKFFYRIRERFDLLNPTNVGEDPIFDVRDGEGFDKAVSLMAMEYLNSGVTKANQIKTMEQARGIIKPLLTQCRHVVRKVQDDTKSKPQIGYEVETKYGFKADAALLVRFLAHKGIER
ncbi:MAG: type III-B CRISPR-associated protein Cas10/Cmr2 [Thiolinea sp.]